jgi:hypothetical protein
MFNSYMPKPARNEQGIIYFLKKSPYNEVTSWTLMFLRKAG